MQVELYILIAWVAMLLVGVVAFGITITLKYYDLISRPSRDMNIVLLGCYILIAWLVLLLIGVVAFSIYAVIHGY